MVYKVNTNCQKCGGFSTNKTRFVWGEPIEGEIKKGITRKIKMWDSVCQDCGKKEGKVFE